MQYQVCQGSDKDELARNVQRLLGLGYITVGGVSSSGGLLFQAMRTNDRFSGSLEPDEVILLEPGKR